MEDAEELISSHQKVAAINSAIIEAWNAIIEEPDEFLVDLISEATENLCGFKPDGEVVQEFLSQRLTTFRLLPSTVRPPGSTRTQATSDSSQKTQRRAFTGTRPSSISFRHNSRIAESWIDVLTSLCELIYEQHQDEFSKVLELRGRKRPYFSADGSELRKPRQLAFTSIFVESNLSARAINSLCNEVVKLFGYQTDDFKISVV